MGVNDSSIASPSSAVTGEAQRGVRGALSLALSRLLAQVLLAVLAVILPRLMGPELYGRYSGVTAIIAICAVISSAGFPLVEARFLAPLVGTQDTLNWSHMASTIWFTRLVLSFVAALVAGVWTGLSTALGMSLVVIVVVMVLTLCRYMSEAAASILIALGRTDASSLLVIARALLSIPVCIGGYLLAGITGIFIGLAVMHGVLWIVGRGILGKLTTLSTKRYRLDRLRPSVHYNIYGFIGTLSGMLQMWFSVYLLAAWVAPTEAAFLAIAVQASSMIKSCFLGGYQAILPVLSTLEEKKMLHRVNRWGGLILRFTGAGLCIAALTWGFVGSMVVTTVLGERYLPVWPCVSIMFVGSAFYACATTCSGLLYVRGRVRLGTLSLIVYATVTMAGLAYAVATKEPTDIASIIAGVYAVASFCFFVVAYASVGLSVHVWLPLRRTLLLMTPMLLLPFVHRWDASTMARVGAAALFVCIYLAFILLFKLIQQAEVASVWRAVKTRTDDLPGD